MKSLKEWTFKFGRFLRVIDETKHQLSIVNIACIVIVVKVAMATEPSIADLGALLIGLFAHYGKRRINMKVSALDETQTKNIEDMSTKIKDLGDRVGSVAAALGFKNLK